MDITVAFDTRTKPVLTARCGMMETMRRLHLVCLAGTALACAPDEAPAYEQDPFPESYARDCSEIGEPEVYRCVEQQFWDALREGDRAERERVYLLMGEFADELDEGVHPKELSRLYFQKGQLGMALSIENDYDSSIFEVVPAFDRAIELDPSNAIIPTWKDSMEVAFANILSDDVALDEALERAWKNVERMPGGNVLSITGTTIGLALDTGAPQRSVELIDAYECDGLDFCGKNTWEAPFSMPGLEYHVAEAYARVGRTEDARKHLEQALSAPRADEWPYRWVAEEAAADVDAFVATFAAYGEDESPFEIMYANSKYGCSFCHSPY